MSKIAPSTWSDVGDVGGEMCRSGFGLPMIANNAYNTFSVSYGKLYVHTFM